MRVEWGWLGRVLRGQGARWGLRWADEADRQSGGAEDLRKGLLWRERR